MTLFNISKIKWALRKLSNPVKNGTVLEIASISQNPRSRSDILLVRSQELLRKIDKYDLEHKYILYCDSDDIPLKDKSVDYIIASHVLEDEYEPEKLLNEMERVASGGYIESPNAIYEKIYPYPHCLEIIQLDDKLCIYKKERRFEESFLRTKYLFQKDKNWNILFSNKPQLFHIQFYWKDYIKYEINNPHAKCDWIIDEIKERINAKKNNQLHGIKKIIQNIFNNWNLYKYSKNRSSGIFGKLVCKNCKSELVSKNDSLHCKACHTVFRINNKIVYLTG